MIISAMSRPTASARLYPKTSSAARFISISRPFSSLTMIASSAELIVAASRSRLRCNSCRRWIEIRYWRVSTALATARMTISAAATSDAVSNSASKAMRWLSDSLANRRTPSSDRRRTGSRSASMSARTRSPSARNILSSPSTSGAVSARKPLIRARIAPMLSISRSSAKTAPDDTVFIRL